MGSVGLGFAIPADADRFASAMDFCATCDGCRVIAADQIGRSSDFYTRFGVDSSDVHLPVISRVADLVVLCQHYAVGARHIAVLFGVATIAGWVPLGIATPSASAGPC